MKREMSNNIVPSLVNLPVELIYRILDQLDPFNILMSVRNVCTQLDQIIETAHAYQVKFAIRHGEDNVDSFTEDIRRDTFFGVSAE
jgi:hypothetical protein